MRYKQRVDNEGFEVPSGRIYRIACCDCGLVHDFVFVSNDGNPIGIAARRNIRATAAKRRERIRMKTREKVEQINAGHFLELMDRLHVTICTIEDHMRTHIIAEYEPDVGMLIDQASKNLSEAYQLVGRADRKFEVNHG